MTAKLRETGSRAKPVRSGHALAELHWDDGAVFRLVPRDYDGIKTVELYAMDDEGNEVRLVLTHGSLRIIQREIGRLCAWAGEP